MQYSLKNNYLIKEIQLLVMAINYFTRREIYFTIDNNWLVSIAPIKRKVCKYAFDYLYKCLIDVFF